MREQGWASTTEEFEIGLNAVAAPVHDATGEVVAAVGVSGPSYRLTVESFPAVAAHLLAGAKEISARLGYFGPMPGSAEVRATTARHGAPPRRPHSAGAGPRHTTPDGTVTDLAAAVRRPACHCHDLGSTATRVTTQPLTRDLVVPCTVSHSTTWCAIRNGGHA